MFDFRLTIPPIDERLLFIPPNRRPALLHQVGKRMVKRVERRIRDQVDVNGRPWRKLSRTQQSDRPRRPGKRLIASISYQLIGTDSVEVQCNHPAARFIRFGTKPHVIRPRNKQALFWPGARHPVKKVNHPGTAPFEFMGFAEGERDQELFRLIQQAVGNGRTS